MSYNLHSSNKVVFPSLAASSLVALIITEGGDGQPQIHFSLFVCTCYWVETHSIVRSKYIYFLLSSLCLILLVVWGPHKNYTPV